MSTAVLLIIVIALVFGTQYVLASRYDWQCQNCGHVFTLSAAAAVFLPHRPVMRKLARCPDCGARTWASPVPKQ